ncbi:hypothetical protein [Mucilaginibacter myungsuensis]|uniref:Uncharacterized protein n=1 Tax=Mucilaginibacter myungsuensis TaxID=649104 RepID=A0A929L436_9SPHI|nr:hypothetical protein [Mucilaginibacter myungsuensis]MBE9663660.1 hypothetical protein [Mucilaginibacter myungsuensis]MDN3599016.1 hypothetical protein [Mucilaginibacter myungsuensis]
MIATLFNRPQYLRIAFVMLLVFFTGSKIVSPVYKVVKAVYKEVAESSSEEDSTERLAEKDITSAQAFFQNHSRDRVLNSGLYCTAIYHGTAYKANYPAEHYREITSPPPDLP